MFTSAVVVCCRVLQCAAVCCSVLQCVVLCCSVYLVSCMFMSFVVVHMDESFRTYEGVVCVYMKERE